MQFHPSAPGAGTFAKGNAACYGLRLSHVPCVALLAAAVLRSNGMLLECSPYLVSSRSLTRFERQAFSGRRMRQEFL